MKLNQTFKRVFSGFLSTAMILFAVPNIPVYAATGTTVFTYDGYDVSYSVTNEWDGGQNVSVTITNTGSDSILNWALKYNAEGSITNLYNAVIYDSSDTQYVVTNNNWNFEIAPNQSVNFGYDLYEDSFSVPTEFELCSERTTISNGYEVVVNYTGTWDTGVRGEITINNTSDEPLEAWTLSFDTNFTIDNVWDGRLLDANNNHYTIGSEMWTNPIAVGSSKTVGFVGTKEQNIDAAITNFELSAVKIEKLSDIDMNTDNIDLGYIEDLINAGIIEVSFDNKGQIRMIDGQFTDKAINSVEDAAYILNCASSLFGDGFYANSSDIIVQENIDETIYKYTPKVNEAIALGNQIIITVSNQHITSLFSTYDKQIRNVSTVVQLSEENAKSAAVLDLLSTYSLYVDALVDESGLSQTEVEEILINSLTVDTQLVIKSDNNGVYDLLWRVKLKNEHSIEDDEDEGIIIDYEDIYDYGKYILPSVGTTYFIYANGNTAGSIMSKTSDTRNWIPTTATGNDLLDNLREFNVESEEHGYAYRLNDTIRNIRTHDMRFLAGIPNLPGSTFISLHNTWEDKSAVSAHANLEEVYDYYNNVLHWNSYDGEGAIIKDTVHYCEHETDSYNNAFWNGSQFVFGNGNTFEAALDIVGHEFTHAVINYKIFDDDEPYGLDYYGETGALNEAYADIMGSLIEGKDKIDDDRWYLAEDSDAILRSMKEPTVYGQPDHYSALSDPTWSSSLDSYEDRDNEGVHIFSGIFNHAAYIMMTDSRTSTISDETWAKVFFKSLSRLTTTSKFIDARGAIICSAKLLGFSENQQEAIKDAFDQVGISSPNTIRIVLRWSATPNDLDSHLTGPGILDGDRFHVYYSQRNYYQDNTYSSTSSLLAADLDYDDTSSFGPEICTIHILTPGDYYFYVQDFSNRNNLSSTALSSSHAIVNIFQGSTNTIMTYDENHPASFSVPSSGIGNLWTVCKISVDDSGNVIISPINTLSNHSTPSTIGS